MAKRLIVPKLCLHRASGRAYSKQKGRRIYFGKYGTPQAEEAYRRWAAGLLLGEPQLSIELAQQDLSKLTMAELAAAYLEWAEGYYRKNGSPTSQISKIQRHLKALLQCHRTTFVEDFGPNTLRRVQDRLAAEGHTRQGVNELVKGIRAVFKWGVSRELVRAPIHQALCTVPPLKYGRTKAPESKPIKPVADEVVDATLPALPEVVADMVRLQRLTGMRPGEVCKLRPCDLDRSHDVWIYTPPDHKTAHLGRDRIIFVGPKAQVILRPYLLRPADSYCFSPAESERRRRARQHEARKTPLSCGNRPQGHADGPAGDRYCTLVYRRAIERGVSKVNRERNLAAKAAGIPIEDVTPLVNWFPNQLRHTAGTAIRRQFGLEAAQVALGHASADTTQIYAEKNAELAREVAKRIG